MGQREMVVLYWKPLIIVLVSFGLANLGQAQQVSPSIDQARKEGEVVWYGSITMGTVGRVLRAFESKYPFIKARYLRLAGGASLIERVRTEAKAGKNLWDVVSATDVQFFELKKMVPLAIYHSPEAAAYPQGHKDPSGTWVDIYGTIASIAYNTRMVKPADAPKDWKDLLDSKWKGRRIGISADAYQWYGNMVIAKGEREGREIMNALAAQDPQLQRGYTNTANLLIAGEFPVAVVRVHRIETAREGGAPVDWSADANPVTYDTHPMAISAKAPRPGAARLFFDFMISKEGQELFTSEGFISPRSDVETRFPRLRLGEIKHVFPSNPRVSERLEVWIKEFHRTFNVK